MSYDLINAGGEEDSFQIAAELVDHVAKVMRSQAEDNDGHTVYKWSNSAAGENLVATIPKGRGPTTLVVDGISRTFRRALLGNNLDNPVESDVAITLNTPESGQSLVDIRSGEMSLGNLAVGMFRHFATEAGLLREASMRQRVGRSMLRWFEARLASLEKLTVRDGQSFIGPYDF